MTRTFEEIKARMKQYSEIELVELLQISSEDIVERFDDRIEENIDFLEADIEELYDDEDEDPED